MASCPESFKFSPTCEFEYTCALGRSGSWPVCHFWVNFHTVCRLVCRVVVLVLDCDLLSVFRVPEFALDSCSGVFGRAPRAPGV